MVYHQAPGGASSSSMTSYAPPMGSPNVPATTEEKGEGGGKVQNMAKKFGSKVGEAAVFGFGATRKLSTPVFLNVVPNCICLFTVGSEAAHAIF